MRHCYRLAGLILPALLGATWLQAGAADYTEAAKFEFAKGREALAAVEAEIRSTPPEQYGDIEAKLLAALKAPDATVDGKRFILRYLSIAGSAKCVPDIAEYLGHEQLAHSARMALEALPAKEALEALRKALGSAKGKQLAGVVSSLGAKRDAEAVPALGKLAGEADPVVAEAALNALGAIGTPEAAQILDEAAPRAPEALKRAVAKARVACAGRLAATGKGDKAAAIYKTLLDNPPAPAARIAALRGLIAALERPEAAKLIERMLDGEDAGLRNATLAAYCGSADKELKDAVATQLPGLKPQAQEALLGVLGGMPEVAARAGLLKILQDSKEEKLRVAALDGLATHGEGADVEMLVKLAAQKPESPETKSARSVLDKLGKAAVNEALSKMLDAAPPPERAVILGVFATRHVEAALPALLKLMNGNDAAAAIEAVKSIEILGTAAEMAAVAANLAATEDANLRGALEAAATAIASRATDKEACALGALPALDKAKTAAARCALLRILTRIKTDACLAAVRKALDDKDAEVSEAAARALTDWPESAAVPYLVELAKTTAKENYAVLAMRGCLRLAGVKERPAGERLDIYKQVLETAKRPEEKKQALAGTADLMTPEALALLRGYFEDRTLGDDAANAAIRMARQGALFLGDKAPATLEAIRELPGASEQLKKAAEEAIKAVKNTGQLDGFIVAWMMAGPYTQEGKGCSELFDIVFDPEKPDASKVAWRGAQPEKGKHLIELDKLIGGNERVAYLKTGITSEMDQEVLLEVGSDDGVKIWLNGQVVHANNATRACQEGQDKVKLKLKQGANTLLCKVTQGGGEWALVARLRSAGGKEAVGTTVSPK
ncbi:MAG: HEAT repeat domain-containing protein [Planctomycetota bacterium]